MRDTYALLILISSFITLACSAIVTLHHFKTNIVGYYFYCGTAISLFLCGIFAYFDTISYDILVASFLFELEIFSLILATVFFYLFLYNNYPSHGNLKIYHYILLTCSLLILFSFIGVNSNDIFYSKHIVDQRIIFNYESGLIALFIFFYCIPIMITTKRFTAKIKKHRSYRQFEFVYLTILLLSIPCLLYTFRLTDFDFTNIFMCIPFGLFSYGLISFGVMDTIPYVKKNLFEMINDPIIITNTNNIIEHVNLGFETVFNKKRSDVVNLSLNEFVMDNHFYFDKYRNTLFAGNETESIYQVNKIVLNDTKNREFGYLHILKDVTLEKKAVEQLMYLTAYDPFTGLLNSESFKSQMEDFANTSDDRLKGGAVVFMRISNIDSLKGVINIEQQREIVKEVAIHLENIVFENDLISSYEENEYCIFITPKEYDRQRIEDLYHKSKNMKIEIADNSYLIQFHCSVYLINSADVSVKDSITRALFALNQCDDFNGIQYYQHEFEKTRQLRQQIINSIANIDYEKEFYLEYQPIVDISRSQIHGAEVLVRWNHPVYGLISPAVFIPIFEDANLMENLGYFVIKKAMIAKKSFDKFTDEDFVLSINISKKQILDLNFIPKLKKMMLDLDFKDLSSFDFEITETVISTHIKPLIKFCKEIRALKGTISLDDFGAGNTAISYITELSPNSVKLDLSLSEDSHIIAERGIVIRSILEMCNSLNMKVVVEHVETNEVLENLYSVGFELIQGWIFSRSLPYESFVEYYLNYITSEEEKLRFK